MSAPAAAPNPGANRTAGFDGVLSEAMRDRALGTTGAPSAADPEPRALLRYASGRASDGERAELEGFVARSAWAYERVVCLVKASRPDAPALPRAIASRLGDAPTAAAAIAGAVIEARDLKPGTHALDFAAVLEKNPKADETTRAALLLGLGRPDEAKKLLKSSGRDPLADLLHRLASLPTGPSRTDQALLAVLDVFPALLHN